MTGQIWKTLCLVVLLSIVSAEIESCQSDQDCTKNMYVCNMSESVCQRKSIFPITLQELLGSLCILLVVGVGQAAGIGGGLVIVPLLMSFYNYDAKKSIALVFVTICSASLGNLFFYLSQRYKDGGPLIDYRIVLLSLPTIMVGTIYGVSFNKFLPQIAISFMLVFFIVKSLTKTYASYRREKKKEDTENSLKAQNLNEDAESSPQLQEMQAIQSPSQADTSVCKENVIAGKPSALSQENTFADPLDSQRQYPRAQLRQILCITLCFLAFAFLRGGSKFESLLEIPACGMSYHLSNLALLLGSFMIVKNIISGYLVGQTNKTPLLNTITPPKHDHLTADEMQSFSTSAFVAGLIGAIVGIGGGMILVPKWLELGIPTQRTAACSIFLLFLTAFNSVVQFGLSGIFEVDELVYFCCLSLLSSYLVSSSIQQYVEKTNQQSLLILIILLFMIIALLLFSTLTIQIAFTDFGSLFNFGEFC